MVAQGRNLIFTIAAAHISFERLPFCLAREKYVIFVYTRHNFVRQRPTLTVGTFDVCLARPTVCPTDIVRPHATQLMIDSTVDQFLPVCKYNYGLVRIVSYFRVFYVVWFDLQL